MLKFLNGFFLLWCSIALGGSFGFYTNQSISGASYGTNIVSAIYCGTDLVWAIPISALPSEVAWFKCDDAFNSYDIVDSSVNGVNATNITDTTAASSVEGKIGLAQAYDMESGFATEGEAVKSALLGNAWTLCFWAKRTDGYQHATLFDIHVFQGETEQQIMSYYNTDNNYLFWYWFVATEPAGLIGVYVDPPFEFPADTWMHFVYIKNGGTYSEVINNGQYSVTITPELTPLFDAIRSMQIGGFPGIQGSTRIMDDVRLYNFALSQSEIAFIYNNGAGTNAPVMR